MDGCVDGGRLRQKHWTKKKNPILLDAYPSLCGIKRGQEEDGERCKFWGVGGWGLEMQADRQSRTSLMLSEAETLSITHAQGISVETLAPSLASSLAP